MSVTSDRDVTETVLGDPFHRGLAEHGKFKGFARVQPKTHKSKGMTDEEIETAKKRLDRRRQK